MGSLRLLLNSGLLFLSAVVLTINGKSGSDHSLTDEGRLPHNIIPLHYVINLELLDTGLIVTEGECHIYIQIYHPTRNIRFHVDESNIDKLLRLELMTEFKSVKIKPIGQSPLPIVYKKPLYNKKYQTATLFNDTEITSGYYILHLKFRNIGDKNKSLFRTSYINEVGDRKWLVATDFQAIGARKLFPCWDEPEFRAIFNISIKHRSDYMVLSNMPVQEIRKTEQPNMTWTVFESTPLMPTYHVSAMLTHFSNISMGKVHIRWRSQLNFGYIRFAYNFIDKVTKHLKSQEKCFERFSQVKHVAIPGFLHDAVSNLGLIYYRETAIIYDKEKDSAVRQTEIARLIGRTVAYQCFDRAIPSWWSYMWLNEGIAMLLGMDAIDEAYPTLRMKDYFVVQIQQESLRFDTDSTMKPLISEVKSNDLSDIDSVFSISYYIKAPVIMRMLQQILTNNVFRKGISTYLNKEPEFLQTTTPDVLWAAMQTAYNETREYNEERLNIKQIMDTWTKQQHYPVVKVIQNESFVTAFVESMNTKEYNWWIPYTIATQMDLNFFLTNRLQQFKMQNSFWGKDFFSYNNENGKWIIFNVQQIGYYRVNYNAKSWQNIVRYLNSDEYAKIHVLNRAQIIDDAFYFLMKGQIDLSIFLELASYLSQERDYVAWFPMFKAFEYMSSFFPFPESTHIKNTMIKILDILLKEIGYEKRSEPSLIINSLTEEAAKWACTLGSLKCRKEAGAKLITNLKENYFSTNMWMKEWTLCNGLMEKDSHTWNWVRNEYREESNYTILKFLACSENFFNIRNNIELIALNEKTKDDNQIHIFHSIVARHAKNDTTLDYILANFDKVKPRNISATVALVDIINHVYSKEQLNKITEFLKNYQKIRITGLSKHKMKEDTYMNNIGKYLVIIGKVSSFKRKMKIRLSQIMKQIYHFHILY